MGDDTSTAHRVAAAVQRHARWRAFWEAETAIAAVISDPEVRRLGEEIQREELRLGLELRPCFQAFQDRYDEAVRDLNVGALIRTCPGKHGRWGRICVLPDAYEVAQLHWGINAKGQPIAWLGSAPDDD
ncbi:hypothetical protein [Streptomyces antimycoticus]|uniref:hypothetical protein n=1 Tax=Streptomyces antimycoticus TaxID=68175 RepID=UPI0036E95857